MQLSPEVGNAVREARENAAMTQQQLARTAQLSVRALSHIECGRVALPRVSTLFCLAHALGLSGQAAHAFVVDVRRLGRRHPPGVDIPA